MTEYMKIETQINRVLQGDSKTNAMDFVSFCRANELALDPGEEGNGEGWAVGGTVGNSNGYLSVTGKASSDTWPGPWVLWLNSCDFGSGDSVDDALKEAAWANASPCGKCHDGWADCGGGDRTIFGKNFERLCHSPLMFSDPDAETLEQLKTLLLMLKG